NSEFGTGNEYHDCLTDDESVIAWLKAAKQLTEYFTDTPAVLMNVALSLRQAMVQTIEAVRSG
ncbi:ABATE domain-containing protein, partial [Pectobacterium brasiliense]|uniref:ABATE domain-containing protein n=1 Tax=Pectobacterium brasiliense TaxID=180957 RepID=UPI0030CA24EB